MKIIVSIVLMLAFVWLICKEYEVRCPKCGKKLKKRKFQTIDGKVVEFWYCENCKFRENIE